MTFAEQRYLLVVFYVVLIALVAFAMGFTVGARFNSVQVDCQRGDTL